MNRLAASPLLFAGLFASAPLLAAPQAVDSRISAVTVYADRAVVTRTARLQLPKGQHEIALEQLPFQLDDASLRASLGASAAATLLDVSSAAQRVERPDDNRVQQLDQQLREIDRQLREIHDRGSVLEAQKKFLADIQSGSTQPGKDRPMPGIDELKSLLQLTEGNLERLLAEQRQLDDRAAELEQRKQQLQEQRGTLNGDGKRFKRAVLRVALEQPAQVEVKLDYTLRDASWQPTYDARLRDGAKTIELTYQGLVRQSSGEDWTDIDLTLSTARRALGGNVPRLNPWIVDIDAPNAYYGAEMAMQDAPAPMPQAAPIARTSAKMAMPASAPKLAEARLATAEVSSGAASASFHIPVPATLNSDGSAQKVTIARLEMPAKLRYLAAPALRETAYLEAETRNDSDYPLLPGTLNTFLGNSFVASGHLRGVMPGESFELALGADEGIGIERKLVKRYTDSSGLIGNRTRVNYEFRIDVRNNHKNAERVQFEDQLPVSRNEQIQVTLLEPKAQEIKREDDGKLKWDWTLQPGEKRSATLKFSVEYPKDLAVSGLD
ncbi:mucoidy inhibitor MuiA [Pseudomonas aeruginosa]|uniref:mucoidy inhibitor MuiA n=1 Tax=Pseudomonas aeruginosa TaxID=287 RepID=UPI0024AFF365|nr:mucoidy inhibitor MuiA [Pseudomonas aeruginosa]MDI7004635.1 mucoidy inhibitor MuiA [Pseudomonas aeruginosa]